MLTTAGIISAKVVNVDAANDLALLKAEGKFTVLPVAASRAVKLGGTVATVVFPTPVCKASRTLSTQLLRGGKTSFHWDTGQRTT